MASPSPPPHLLDVRHVHGGPLYDVYRATLGGASVAVKRAAPANPLDDSLATSWSLYNPTNSFMVNQLGWPERYSSLDASHFEALLRAEHGVIAQAAEHWNHPGAWLARWRADDQLAPPDAPADTDALCLIMPWCTGEPLSSLSRGELRWLYPGMLPALWDALAACRHGDLTLDDLILERASGIFRIFDPGVLITGPANRTPDGNFRFSSDVFTTNAGNYPLVGPEHAVRSSRVFPVSVPGGQPFRTSYRPEHRPALPSLADCIACGAMYFQLLVGRTLLDALGLAQPAWTGAIGEPMRDYARPLGTAVLDAADLAGALRAAGATPAERALCERLIRGELDRDLLERLTVDVRASL